MDKTNVEQINSITLMQEGILFEYLKSKNKKSYFEQLSITLTGTIIYDFFEEAWNKVAETNEVLRSLFRWTGLRKPVQIILKRQSVKISVHDLTSSKKFERQDLLKSIHEEDMRSGFDLEHEVPFRISLCKLDDKEYQMIVSSHHILYDGWSNGIIMNEFLHHYNQLVQGKPLFNPVKKKMIDFIKKINDLQSDETSINYWKDKLANLNHSLLLPTRSFTDAAASEENYYKHTLSVEHKQFLAQQASKHNSTLSSLCFAAWALLLHVYTNRNDVVFGTTMSGRNLPVDGIFDMAGLFIRTLPVRITLDPSQSALNFMRQTHLLMLEAELHNCSPLAQIMQETGAQQDHALFDTLLVIQNYPLITATNTPAQSLAVLSYSMKEHTNYPIYVGVQTFSEITISVSYKAQIFEESFIQKLIQDFEFFLLAFASYPETSINHILDLYNDLLQKNEPGLSLAPRSPTKRLYHEWFEEQVSKTPEHVALIFEGQEWTYEELNNRANHLAIHLLKMGVGPEKPVGVCLDRSVDAVASLLAVMKVGGAFVPIDPEFPKERIADIIRDIQSEFLIIDQYACSKIGDVADKKVFNVSGMAPSTDVFPNVEASSAGTNLAYVLYTSGTSGKPKGVMIENRNLIYFIESFSRAIDFTSDKCILGLSTFSFDIFIVEILLPLVHGMKIIMANKTQKKDPKQLCDLIESYRIGIVQSTPSMLKTILSHPDSVKKLKSVTDFLIGGEPLSDSLSAALREHFEANLYNLYGPTETTVWTTVNMQNERNPIRLGKPIDNTAVYILDQANRIKPTGVPGELCVGGHGVGRGYWQNPELTVQKFVDNPFHAEGLMYRTGDLARWTTNGELEFLGRVDDQVKIRGNRIELAEVESQLLSATCVTAAAVVAKQDERGQTYLCGYVVASEQLTSSHLREHMALRLPDYMIPSFFIQLDQLPLNNNGKLDKNSLPSPVNDINHTGPIFVPKTELQHVLLQLWKTTLSLESEVPADAHFLELGGHSLQAMYLVTGIARELGITVTIQDIFQHPSISSLARFLEFTGQGDIPKITTAPLQESYPLSSAQQGIYISSQWERHQVSYNLPFYIRMSGKVDKAHVENTIQALIRRHESLRTSFHALGSSVIQRIHSDLPFSLEYEEIDQSQLQRYFGDFVKPFNLKQAPLLRIKLLRVADEMYVLVGDFHHIIMDGQSIRNIIRDFIDIYHRQPLTPLRLQYKDYAVWEQDSRQTDAWSRAEKYWLSVIEQAPPLRLPSDFPRQSIRTRKGATCVKDISPKLANQLKELARLRKTTLFSLLLASYSILLHKYSGQEDITVGVPFSGRSHSELLPLAGMFVNTMPIRQLPMPNRTFNELLMQVKQFVLRGFQYQYYPFEELVLKKGSVAEDPAQPLFNTVFTMLEYEDKLIMENGIAEIHFIDHQQAKFDLTLTVLEKDQLPVKLMLEYASDLFMPITADRWMERYLKVLEQIAQLPDMPIQDIRLTDEHELTPMKQEHVDFQF